MKIYEQCSRKIKKAVELKQKQVFIKIPSYVVGYPTFDVEQATFYIKRQFELGGLDVTKVEYNEIYVSWHKASKTKKEKIKPPADDLLEDLPSLMNLKKAICYLQRPFLKDIKVLVMNLIY